MNKSELITAIAATTEVSKKDAEAVVNAYHATVTNAMAKGEKVSLIGFGTFEARRRAEKKGRNPQTGEEITIPESRAACWRPGNLVKEAVAL